MLPVGFVVAIDGIGTDVWMRLSRSFRPAMHFKSRWCVLTGRRSWRVMRGIPRKAAPASETFPVSVALESSFEA